MDQRARIPVSLPRDNPTQSYWQIPPSALADYRSSPNLPDSADTVIIGSGITGAAVAWHLLSQSTSPGSILMLEARQVCSGATGRNGGHTKTASYLTFPANSLTHSPKTAAQIALLEYANINAMHAFAQEHVLPRGNLNTTIQQACSSRVCDTIDVFYSPSEWAAAQAGVAALKSALPEGHPAGQYKLLSAEEVKAGYFVHDNTLITAASRDDGKEEEERKEEKVQGGVRYAAGNMSAYEFVVGVIELCLERGMGLQTGTVVTRVKRQEATDEGGERRWIVETERGTVKAKRVVLATNGYTAGIVPKFQGVIVPLRGQVTAQRPGRNMPFGGCLPTTYSFIYDKGYEYMITRPEGSRFAGDVIMGGGLVRAPDNGLLEFGNTDDTTLNEGISQYLKETTPRYFGSDWGEDDPEGRVRNEWTGIMGFSPDGLPLVGEVPGEDGLWASCSFQGHGMVLCWMCAKALVDMMEGKDGEALREWFPEVFSITEERLAMEFQGRLH